MTIVHRNHTDSEKRSYASVAAIPAITIPAPVAVQNNFSALHDTSSESEIDKEQFDWKTAHSSDSDESDTIAYANMTNNSTSDSSPHNSANDSASDSSQEELIVNQKHYRRVRPSKCKEGIPCFVTSCAGLLVFAYFMQFVFYMCGFINDDCSTPAGRLQYSKYSKNL